MIKQFQSTFGLGDWASFSCSDWCDRGHPSYKPCSSCVFFFLQYTSLFIMHLPVSIHVLKWIVHNIHIFESGLWTVFLYHYATKRLESLIRQSILQILPWRSDVNYVNYGANYAKNRPPSLTFFLREIQLWPCLCVMMGVHAQYLARVVALQIFGIAYPMKLPWMVRTESVSISLIG